MEWSMEDEEPLGDIEPGNVLMHNHVRSFDIDADNGDKVYRAHGDGGFRRWQGPLLDGFELCDCGWRPDLGPHYSRWREGGQQAFAT
jgi:hypothetical protein